MDIKKHAIVGCGHNYGGQTHDRFSIGCHQCLVASVIELCEILEEHPDLARNAPSAPATSLTEVFQGTQVAHITEGRITNVVALPMTPADLEEGIVRYTVEFRKDK